jgi:glycosyltransferase involved in cell wall biosynthesis
MISVLIPVYNYNIEYLVQNLLDQLEFINCKWEILISDDASNIEFTDLNTNFLNKINCPYIKYFRHKENRGNSLNRNHLIKEASYSWLLFLDADVLPVKNDFILVYYKYMLSTWNEIIAGNIVYDDQNPLPHLLRWKYGKAKEELSLKKRKKNPILNIRGANFAIKKDLAEKYCFLNLVEKYGFVDTLFFLQFNEKQVCVIENPVYHLGIEENIIFLNKSKKAVRNALFLLNKNEVIATKISLILIYKKIRVLKRVFYKMYITFYRKLERDLMSSNPSVLKFQIYKILYIGYLDVIEDIN